MSDTELLSVDRAARFISYTLSCDLQIKIHRSTALGHFRGALAREGDQDVIEFASEKYDKIMTFLTENDQQVHYAASSNTVGVYAIVRLLGDLRRQLRDYTQPGYAQVPLGAGPAMMSPRTFQAPRRPRAAPTGHVPALNVAAAQEAARQFMEPTPQDTPREQEQDTSRSTQEGEH